MHCYDFISFLQQGNKTKHLHGNSYQYNLLYCTFEVTPKSSYKSLYISTISE